MFAVSVDDKATGTAILLYLHPFVHEGNIQLFPAALSVDLECLSLPMAMQSKGPLQPVWIFGLKTTAMAQVHCSRGNNLIKVNGRWLETIKPSKLLEPVLLLGRILFLCPPFSSAFPPNLFVVTLLPLSPSFSSSLPAKHMLMFSLIQSCSCQNSHDLHIANGYFSASLLYLPISVLLFEGFSSGFSDSSLTWIPSYLTTLS